MAAKIKIAAIQLYSEVCDVPIEHLLHIYAGVEVAITHAYSSVPAYIFTSL